MRKILLSLFVVGLAGCATTSTMYGPDGKAMTAISCDGSAVSPSVCFAKAGEICGTQGYDILASDGSANPYGAAYGQADRNNAMVVSNSGMMVTRTLFVRCKG